jgi:GTP-binding protein EngB required for normal cell division
MAEPEEEQVVPLKQYVDDKFEEMQRAVDVAREGVPPHVTIQEYFEMLLNEREKAVQLALTSADKLEQERIARSNDQTACERRIAELTRNLSETAILKAEASQAKQFDEFSKTVEEQISVLRTTIQDLTRRFDKLA